MRQTTKLLMIHLPEPLALIAESYIINVTRYICDIATAGHWELLDQLMGSDQNRLDSALYGAARGDSISLVQHVLDCGANDYGHGLLGACCGINLDAAKLILGYERRFGSSGYSISSHMKALGQYSGSIKMFNWFCDEFNPGPALISETVRGAVTSANMDMISATLTCGGGMLTSNMMFNAGESGERGMVVLLKQYGGLYNAAFVGACYAGQINLVKWLMEQKQSADYNYNHGFTNACDYLEVLKYLAANAEISSESFTFVLHINIHNTSNDYVREISAAAGLNPDRRNREDIVRWITGAYGDRIDGDVMCAECKIALRDHPGIRLHSE